MKEWFQLNIIALGAGCVLDWILGDPLWLPHPVRLMGRMIQSLEKGLRRLLPERETAAGFFMALAMVLFWILVPVALLGAAGFVCLKTGAGMGPVLLLMMVMDYQLLAARGLFDESMKVGRFLKQGKLEQGRQAVSMIVGRDTAALDSQGIIRAAVETVAENTSDGVIAPMLYMALLGPAGGFFYKAVNTMDSMTGYKNQRYIRFGRIPARLDDLVNLIPSRLTGLLFCGGAWVLPGFLGKNAWKIFIRDRFKHASPNSAQSEAACAGALGLRLAGDAWYFGQLCHKPYIGDGLREADPRDIGRANGLMIFSQILFMAFWLVLLAAG